MIFINLVQQLKLEIVIYLFVSTNQYDHQQQWWRCWRTALTWSLCPSSSNVKRSRTGWLHYFDIDIIAIRGESQFFSNIHFIPQWLVLLRHSGQLWEQSIFFQYCLRSNDDLGSRALCSNCSHSGSAILAGIVDFFKENYGGEAMMTLQPFSNMGIINPVDCDITHMESLSNWNWCSGYTLL